MFSTRKTIQTGELFVSITDNFRKSEGNILKILLKTLTFVCKLLRKCITNSRNYCNNQIC